MQLYDVSPPASPTLKEQRDALQKGLGRVQQWAKAGCLDEELLRDACLHDQRFDMQIEENRGAWLWEAMTSLGFVQRFRGALLDALRSVAVERDAYQLCELALHYSLAGDSEFEAQLYEFVKQKPIDDCPWIGEGQLLQLGGDEAFMFIARVRGRLLESQPWDWDLSALVDRAIEILGEQWVNNLLASTQDAAIGQFATVWKQQQTKQSNKSASHRADEMRAIKLADILSGTSNSFRGWGMQANESDLEVVLETLWATQDPKTIVNLLKVFSKRPLPYFDSRIIQLCGHENEAVRQWAFNALEENAHPLIRTFALEGLQNRGGDRRLVSLFIRNFVKGDEQRLLDLVELPEDDVQRHWVLMDVIKMIEVNHDADSSILGLIAYAKTPCEMCRHRAVELVVRQNAAPAWLMEECRHDSSEECRAFVQRIA